MSKFFFILAFIIICVSSNLAQKKNELCYKWRTQVDPKLERIEIDERKLNDYETLESINCLLNLQGNNKKARFSGATQSNIYASNEQKYKTATIEIAALYYVSYIFYKNWQHAGSISLYDAETEKSNSKKNIKRAFKSYRDWFERVKRIGLEKAREQKLDPLENSGVSWS